MAEIVYLSTIVPIHLLLNLPTKCLGRHSSVSPARRHGFGIQVQVGHEMGENWAKWAWSLGIRWAAAVRLGREKAGQDREGWSTRGQNERAMQPDGRSEGGWQGAQGHPGAARPQAPSRG